MPVFKCLNGKDKFRNHDAHQLVADYILNPAKSPSGIRGGYAVGLDTVASMDEVTKRFNKDWGVQLHHYIISYTPKEVSDPEILGYIAMDIAGSIAERYQVIFAVHENIKNLHIHLMFNSVSYVDGYKYSGSGKDFYKLRQCISEANHTFRIYDLRYVSSKSKEDIQ